MPALSAATWRLVSLPLVLGALFLVGSPELPAFERAVANAFRAAPPVAPPVAPAPPRQGPAAEPASRGVLIPLYVAFASLQALDVHSTMRAVGAGHAERNPLLATAADRPPVLLAVKAGAAATTIYLVDRLRVRSRGAAIALMAVLNSAYAAIVAHNHGAVR